MSERYMPSIFPECDKLKQSYDKCFTTFFQKYLNSDYRLRQNDNPCRQLFETYQKCVEKKLTEERPYDIDLDELRREVLNRSGDSFESKQQQ